MGHAIFYMIAFCIFENSSLVLNQWFSKSGGGLREQDPCRRSTESNYFHNYTKTLFALFTVLTLTRMLQKQLWQNC